MSGEHPQPVLCPFCRGALQVSALICLGCGVRIEGRFAAGEPFAALPREQQAFAALFLLSSGNLKRVGQRLGISYPTVKARLAEVQGSLRRTLGPAEAPKADGDGGRPATNEVLSALERGEIDVESALRLLGGAREEEDDG